MTVIESKYNKEELRILQRFLESFFFGLIKSLKSEDIITYAEKNSIIDPRRYIYSLPNHIKVKIRNIINNNRDLIDEYFTLEKLIPYIEKKRKDLWYILQTPQYKNWLDKFILICKKVIIQI